MNQRNMSRGQMSFDLGFAILSIIMVFSMLLGFGNSSMESTYDGRKLMAMNMAADYIIGNLNAFYASLIGSSSTVTYRIEYPDDYVFNVPIDENVYEIDYEVEISPGSDLIIISDPSTTPVNDVKRKLGFDIICGAGGISGPFSKGSSIIFMECSLNGAVLECAQCITS